MFLRTFSSLLFLIALACGSVQAAVRVSEVLPPLPVAAGNIGDFATAVAYFNGNVYTINVEPASGTPNGMNLQTVVRKGTKTGPAYTWTSKVVESRTLDDPYHTLGSIAVDKKGYIHVAYNMHNMPWQYSVSANPEDISEFLFRGEPLSDSELGAVKYANRTPFPYLGQAAIPGTQVTYPAFFYDRTGELYISYRFALKPKRAWADREYSGGLARYDTASRTWTPLGAPVALSPEDADLRDPATPRSVTTFCSAKGWWANEPRLLFDEQNHMHVAWSWSDYGRFQFKLEPEPTYAYATTTDGVRFMKSDGRQYNLPITFEASDLIVQGNGFHGVPNIALLQDGSPAIMVIPPKQPYHYVVRDGKGGRWGKPVPSPSAAQVVFIEDDGTGWAFATGPTIYMSKTPQDEKSWQVVHKEDGGWIYPKIVYLRKERAFLVHLTKRDNWQPAADRHSPTKGDCLVRIIRIDL